MKVFLLYCGFALAAALTGLYIVPALRSTDGCSAFAPCERKNFTEASQTAADCPTLFALVITVQLVPKLEEEWLYRWKQLAQHVWDTEPSTISYELLEVEGKENTYIVYERYCDKSDLHDPHQLSQPFKDFKSWCAQTNPYIIKDGRGAHPTGIGHWSRW